MTDLKRNIVDVPNPSERGLRYRYFRAMTKLPRDGILARVEGPTEANMRTEAEEEWRRVEEIRREVNEVVSVGVLRERFCLRKKRM
ncbi:hypothetical protein Godav_029573 [Gossypium davidsonii]|uniref:Uncharacterized protein n=1 Tax=Gossypium davidsonii TaxID=34287 RepID=A0A7J8T963_GOSDV|nr:hypothetical protein [Gossypium davidsonii]